jgi:hypothetical protein
MIKTKQQNSGFILKLDEDSEIKEVIFNSRKDQIRFDSQNFSQFIDPGSLKKYFSILKEAREKEVVFGREINLQLGEKTESYIFIVLNNLADESILIAANQSEGIIKYRCLSRKLSHLVKNFFEYYSCRSSFKSSAG